jgi:NADH-quinone oxidoreductase subunit G
VLEFLLINHPLDCPICDQAGECELQDYVFQEGRAGSRYDDYPKRFNPVKDFGPDILYVPNRCILCTRCVRFMDDVAKTPVLNVSERGDRATIGIFPDQQLDHPWSGNCPGCTQGCNVSIETRDNTVVRLRPRPNMEVNRHFMCDEGRMNYRWMNRGDRVEAPRVREGNRHQAVDWDTALTRLAQLLEGARGSAVLLASGRASTESLGHLRRMLDRFDVTAAIKVPLGEEAPLEGVPALALRSERVPNLAGATLMGYTAAWDNAVKAAAEAALVVLVDEPLTAAELATVRQAGALVALGTREGDGLEQADMVLPITTMAEEYGTYINRDHRLQRYLQAKSAPGMARPAWWIAMEALMLADEQIEAPGSAAEAFTALGAHVPSLAGLTYQDIGFVGRIVTRDIPVGAGR